MGRPLGHTAALSSAFLLAMLSTVAVRAQTSLLWGAHGESWSAQGRLPDFSHAGYHEGADAIPDLAVASNVLDFGAVGDGVADDGPAIQAALDATTSGAVLLPKGRYRIQDVLLVEKSGVVLRGEGAGPDGSVVVIDKSLTDVLGADEKWSYSGGFIHFRSPAAGAPLTAVTGPRPRGERSIGTLPAAGLSPGQLVELRQVDDGTGSLGRHLHAELADSGSCAYQVPLRFDWPVRIESVNADGLTLRQPLRTDLRPEWSPEIWSLPAIAEVGVERLRVEFPELPYAGHLKEPGYNAIFFSTGVVDGWVRDVTVVNADNAFLTEQRVKNVSFVGVRLEGRPGHHGFNLNQSSDVLISEFFVDNEWWHTVTVDHRTNGTVVSRGNAVLPLSLDHHRDSPFENLFTELSASGFQSGGSACAGPQAGARNTYWNLAGPMVAPLLWGEMQTNLIGPLSDEVAESLSPDRAWFERLPQPDPPNLYLAQLAARLCPPPTQSCQRPEYDAASGSCSEVARSDGSTCDDGDPGTTADACGAGVCRGIVDDGAEQDGGCGCRARAPHSGGAVMLLALLGLLALRRP